MQHGAEYEKIIKGVTGDVPTKKLAVQLIVRYFSKFADKRDMALDGMFTLCEDCDINVCISSLLL